MSDRKGFVPRDHYAEVTNKIIAMLESGTPPWRRPWDPTKAAMTGPVNGATGRRYRGVNTLILGMSERSFETGDPRWCSYQQAQERGWQVRKGERGTSVIFFKRVEMPAGEGTDGDDPRIVPVVRAYTVFHASQIDKMPEWVPPTLEEAPWRAPETIRTILDASGVPIRVGGDRAFYSPSTDHIQIPVAQSFSSPEGWATTALHELGHGTGHPARLDRNLSGRFGSQAYAMEELRAEIASAMICAELGVPSELEQHASYVESWLEVLKGDRREIFRAAADAQRAADWVLDRHPAYRLAREAAVSSDRQDAAKMPEIPAGDVLADDLASVVAALPDHVRRAAGLPEPSRGIGERLDGGEWHPAPRGP